MDERADMNLGSVHNQTYHVCWTSANELLLYFPRKDMFWGLKRNVSVRRFIYTPITYVLKDNTEKIIFCVIYELMINSVYFKLLLNLGKLYLVSN